MQDLISRQAAIDALDVLCQEHRYKIPGKRETYSQYNEAWQDALDRAEGAIFNLPSAQPTVVQDILQYLDEYLHPIVSPEHWNVYSELYDMISMLPSTQPEQHEIGYSECASAMLKMWMDNVLTDGEYNRIMDKLNAYWVERRKE